jgi:hypothetical protein
MIPSYKKTSLLVPSQLPAFIRDNPSYSKFVLFVQAYYQWMEQQDNVTDVSKNLLNYHDIDSLLAANTALAGTSATVNEFIDYFQNDFLSYFPKDMLANKSEVIKLAKQLYQSKGTPASYQFLFRTLYNSDVDIFNTKDAVFKASAGTWYVPVSLRLESRDTNFLSTIQLKVFGLTSKSVATIDNVVLSPTKLELFISNGARTFQSGEYVNVVDSNNQIVYFLNGQLIPTFNYVSDYLIGDLVIFDGVTYIATLASSGIDPTNTNYWSQYSSQAESLTSKIIGQISQINIDSNYQGLYYQPGYPVIVYGGLANVANPHQAVAQVGTVTSGSIQRINTLDGGYGYTSSPNTVISFTNAPGAAAVVGSLDPTPSKAANATFVPTDSISSSLGIRINSSYSFFANNVNANANTSLANAFNFISFVTNPISSLVVESGGSGIFNTPIASATSTGGTQNNNFPTNLSNLGILAPIQIVNAGKGYQANDTIVLSGGTGRGAYANVLSVNSIGAIQTVGYVYKSQSLQYPLGGLGYGSGLPTATVVSSNNQAANASVYVPGILGSGAIFNASTDRIGAITSINILDFGLDYNSTPSISLKVQDLIVIGLDPLAVPQKGDIVYQGSTLNSSVYNASVNTATLLVGYANTQQSIWALQVYNYNTQPNTSLPIIQNSTSAHYYFSSTIPSPYVTNVKNYGDGTARASAVFQNGLTFGQGQYLDTSGQLSGYDILQSSDYNNYTYELSLDKEIAHYKDILLNLLHPAGMHVLGRYNMKSNSNFNFTTTDAIFQGYPLYYYTGTFNSVGTMSATFDNPATNLITFDNLSGAQIQNFIFANSSIALTSTNGDQITSQVISIILPTIEDLELDIGLEDLMFESGADDLQTASTSPTVTLLDSFWLAYANVAYVTANAGGNVINITSLTGSYDIINDGIYTDPNYPLKDIIRTGDSIKVNNMIRTVSSVNYSNNRLTLTENLTYAANGLLSVTRTYKTNNVQIFGPVGLQYVPQLVTEDDISLTDELGNILILG